MRTAEGTYEGGKLHGAYVEYAADGTVKSTEQWEHGNRVAQAAPPDALEDE